MPNHEGHRERKKEQFRQHGLDSFADHEALELLLYYAIPRRDTNQTAHALLDRFGTLEGVFLASRAELMEVPGVGENTATLLTLLLPLFRRINRGGKRNSPVILDTLERRGSYFLRLLYGARDELFYQASLDAKGKLLECTLLSEGGSDSVSISVRRVVENALRARASAVVLAHNHPSGMALPSREDGETTLQLRAALQTVGIPLVDHIIVADNDFVSLRASGLL